MDHKLLLRTLVLSFALTATVAFPQTPIDSESVHEIQDPEAKRLIFDGFRTQGRSVLYESLGLFPQEGDVVADLVIEVESPVLQLFKPRDAGKKLKERAEARRAEQEGRGEDDV